MAIVAALFFENIYNKLIQKDFSILKEVMRNGKGNIILSSFY